METGKEGAGKAEQGKSSVEELGAAVGKLLNEGVAAVKGHVEKHGAESLGAAVSKEAISAALEAGKIAAEQASEGIAEVRKIAKQGLEATDKLIASAAAQAHGLAEKLAAKRAAEAEAEAKPKSQGPSGS